MSAEIWRAKYNLVLSALTQEQLSFIDNIIYRSDDGTYELSADDFKDLKDKKGELEKTYKTEFTKLFQAFEKEIKKGHGHFSFRVFG